jgi:hypothetical protein
VNLDVWTLLDAAARSSKVARSMGEKNHHHVACRMEWGGRFLVMLFLVKPLLEEEEG